MTTDDDKTERATVSTSTGNTGDRTSTEVIANGFDDIRVPDSNPRGQLQWYCAPDSWDIADPEQREGRGGRWSVERNDDVSGGSSRLVLAPPAKKDFWRKTYYEPILIKDDGPFLYRRLSAEKWYTIETSFRLTAERQFDQAGLMVRLDADHWIKAGIEAVDGRPRLSCVVTNGYSDWSTQPWSDYTSSIKDDEGGDATTTRARIRIHCRGTSFVVQAKECDDEEWGFCRIAHLSRNAQCLDDPLAHDAQNAWRGPAPPEGEMWVGVFACSPEDQRGGHAIFTHFSILEGSSFDHNADGNQA